MIAVGIVGVLSATAIPSFSGAINRSKTAEVPSNLNSMFKLAAAYYASERSEQGNAVEVAGFCTVRDAGPQPATPGPAKQQFNADTGFRALGYSLADFTFFSYGLASKTGASVCGNTAGSVELYTFYAHGDLDGDGTESTFELPAGSDAANVMMHGRAVFIDKETE